MAQQLGSKAQETSPVAVDASFKRSYDYGKGTKSYYQGGGVPNLTDSAFDKDDKVQMKVSGILNGHQIETWKPFTVRGEPVYDYSISTWTYQLNKNGAEYEGATYFPESRLKILKS